MRGHKPATKRKPGGKVYPEPKPQRELLRPRSGCSTPGLAAGMPRELLSALRKSGRKRQAGEGDDTPEAA